MSELRVLISNLITVAFLAAAGFEIAATLAWLAEPDFSEALRHFFLALVHFLIALAVFLPARI